MSNQKLRQARKQRHWTQEQASARIGVAVGTYRRWESGTQLPHPSTLALVCEAFNMSDCDLGFPEDLFLQPAESDKSAAPIYREAERQHTQLPGTDQSLYTFTNEQLAAFTTLLRLGESIMFDPGKRQTLQALLFALSSAVLKPEGLLQPESWQSLLSLEPNTVKVNEATLQGFEKLIQACWQFSKGNELALAEELLPKCMTKLVPLAQQSSKHQQTAAHLVAQGYRLYSIFALHKNNLLVGELYDKQAVQYSLLSGDRNLLIISLRGLGNRHYYQGHYPQALQTYLEALQHVESISPLLQACVYMSLAVAYAHVGQKQNSLTYMGLAHDTFPDYSETDENFSYAEFDRSQMILWGGITHAQIGKTAKALDIFNRIEQLGTIVSERLRIEIFNHRARTAIVSGDLEQGSTYVESGITGAKAIGSQRRYKEAYENYNQMALLWPQEKRVKELRELFV